MKTRDNTQREHADTEIRAEPQDLWWAVNHFQYTHVTLYPLGGIIYNISGVLFSYFKRLSIHRLQIFSVKSQINPHNEARVFYFNFNFSSIHLRRDVSMSVFRISLPPVGMPDWQQFNFPD